MKRPEEGVVRARGRKEEDVALVQEQQSAEIMQGKMGSVDTSEHAHKPKPYDM